MDFLTAMIMNRVNKGFPANVSSKKPQRKPRRPPQRQSWGASSSPARQDDIDSADDDLNIDSGSDDED